METKDSSLLKQFILFPKYEKYYLIKRILTLYCIMLKNGQTYFKNLAVFTPQDFKVCLAIFQHYAINRKYEYTENMNIIIFSFINVYFNQTKNVTETEIYSQKHTF